MSELTDKMDSAAMLAEAELIKMHRLASKSSNKCQQKALSAIADWWQRWYLHAGHKRLGRMLLKLKTEGGNK